MVSYLAAGPVFRFGLSGVYSGSYYAATATSRSLPAAIATFDANGGGLTLGWFASAEAGLYGSSFGGWWNAGTLGLSVAPDPSMILEPQGSVRYTREESGESAWTTEAAIRLQWYGAGAITLEMTAGGIRHASTQQEILVAGEAAVAGNSYWEISLDPTLGWAAWSKWQGDVALPTQYRIADHKVVLDTEFGDKPAQEVSLRPQATVTYRPDTLWQVTSTLSGSIEADNSPQPSVGALTVEVMVSRLF